MKISRGGGGGESRRGLGVFAEPSNIFNKCFNKAVFMKSN